MTFLVWRKQKEQNAFVGATKLQCLITLKFNVSLLQKCFKSRTNNRTLAKCVYTNVIICNLKMLAFSRSISSETRVIMLSVRCAFMEQSMKNKHVTGIRCIRPPVYKFHLSNYSREFRMKYSNVYESRH